ncbi:ATP-dependent RNA helicase Slh1 [Schizosaccharomyces japonicus yFS275]|uniref:RNA helicase n=1 Tax=Schizosaccharomyces japonicus (strain yFS275 / FY16936) TaxID=402676 RepID=B6JWX3_SCHJY|nr:ATP-dependent RNA helicase Slh1 [Schizosaccharomyces japonicus yFS275]EEB05874.1 ATP-dependent RNA helicase Slh1 [Schizosaccharomyces japonicus yFS275]
MTPIPDLLAKADSVFKSLPELDDSVKYHFEYKIDNSAAGLAVSRLKQLWSKSLESEVDVPDQNATGIEQTEEDPMTWLLGCCENVAPSMSLDADALFEGVVEALSHSANEYACQEALISLLGYDNIQLVSDLLMKHHELKQYLETSAIQYAEEDQSGKDETATHGAALLERIKRSKQKALQRTDNRGPLFTGQKLFNDEQYPHVYGAKNIGNSVSIVGKKFALPAGSVREEYERYEEITVPYAKQAARLPGEKPVKISSLNTLCRKTFLGYTSLNRIQSLIFPIAFTTNENMLVCAPTGAGKTDVAMLTILQTLSNYCDVVGVDSNGDDIYNLRKDEFKIVYVAPMKALAAEVVDKMGKRLAWLGVKTREFTGDMQLTKKELSETQLLVTTPEKWDVVTRKSVGDTELAEKVRLLIIDEVHMLHDDRGAVIESIVARTQRFVETSQTMIRIVGLSATLPNYLDVSDFLGVNRQRGLFYFSNAFRPCPIEQHFIGVKGTANSRQSMGNLDEAAFDKVLNLLENGHQVMVFVHSRKDTIKTAKKLKEQFYNEGKMDLLDSSDELQSENPKYKLMQREVGKSKMNDLKELFKYGLGVHNAGMHRSDRHLTEKLFSMGLIKVLCCTATLAWGVNLPAYAVVIKGTQLYDPQKGSFVDLGVLDVLQIFGRAGRPQFESSAEAYIVTTHDKLAHYLSVVTQQSPIESQFVEHLVDNLNAEIALGSVTNIDEAVSWLGYTYLYIRMRKNPLIYGIAYDTLQDDPLLGSKRRELVMLAAQKLYANQMIVYNKNTGYLTPKDLGRIASHYYISYQSVTTINKLLKSQMSEADIFSLLSNCSEFSQIKSRENEAKDLEELLEYSTPCQLRDSVSNTPGKVNVVLQSYISRSRVDDFTLQSDMNYVAQNAGRITRALFEIALSRAWSSAYTVLSICKSIDKQQWSFEHPLAQLNLPREIVAKLENQASSSTSIVEMVEMDDTELGDLVHNKRMGNVLRNALSHFPLLKVEADLFPLTQNVMRISLNISPLFEWDMRIHGNTELFWIFVEDSGSNTILHHEVLYLSRKTYRSIPPLSFAIPLSNPPPSQLYVIAISNTWLGAETVTPVNLSHVVLREDPNPITELLDLQPLPITALQNPVLEEICAKRFSFFNAVQSQFFHTVYHTPTNVFIGAPTGSGKTMAAELATWWAFREHPGSKVVYIAPMKALVKERLKDWGARLVEPMHINMIELTGDTSPDSKTIMGADIIITTPEKWDGITRNWRTRKYVQNVSLVIIDEIHLLGSDRGPILEMIVSRMNYIASQTNSSVRILGLSTAVANAHDLADWLGITDGLFNFRHSVRPVPLEIYIDGFPGRAYGPRMMSMNKPAFQAIKTHSPTKPVIIFVSSRRQTRYTARDLISFCALEDNPRRFLNMKEEDLEMVLTKVEDKNLKMSLPFGIGLHHAGLTEDDRRISEELFVNNKIQILIATSTIAWGVNTPAHLVIVKGTEYYDAKIEGYKDMDQTDVLQMLGRAGRPQFDTEGVARIFVQDTKKSFYKHFLHSGFPVESYLHKVLEDHINAEIASGTLHSRQDAMDFLTWTYFYRRVYQNPVYYGAASNDQESVDEFLSQLINNTFKELELSACIYRTDNENYAPTSLGRIVSYYYISHRSVRNVVQKLRSDFDFPSCLQLLAESTEFDDLAIRHTEDITNAEINKTLKYNAERLNLRMVDAHVKTFILSQAHMARLELPVDDYITDTFAVLDQIIRIIQAYLDVSAELSFLNVCFTFISILQCLKQACYPDELYRNALPSLTFKSEKEAKKVLYKVAGKSRQFLEKTLAKLSLVPESMDALYAATSAYPDMDIHVSQKSPELVHLQIRRCNPPLNPDFHIYSEKFPKPQTEGWFVLIGNPQTDELFAIRRASMLGKNSAQQKLTLRLRLDIPAPCQGQNAKVYVISDSYPLVYEHSIHLMSPSEATSTTS